MSAKVDKSRKAWSSLLKDHESPAVEPSVRAGATGDAMVVLGKTEACSPWNTFETRPNCTVDDGQTACPGGFENPSPAAPAARMNQSAEFFASQFHQHTERDNEEEGS